MQAPKFLFVLFLIVACLIMPIQAMNEEIEQDFIVEKDGEVKRTKRETGELIYTQRILMYESTTKKYFCRGVILCVKEKNTVNCVLLSGDSENKIPLDIQPLSEEEQKKYYAEIIRNYAREELVRRVKKKQGKTEPKTPSPERSPSELPYYTHKKARPNIVVSVTSSQSAQSAPSSASCSAVCSSSKSESIPKSPKECKKQWK